MQIEFKFNKSLKGMIENYSVIKLMYTDVSLDNYEIMLSEMILNGYSQIDILFNQKLIGVAGVWENTKLWCGKYIELDNVVVLPEFRANGIGTKLIQFVELYAEDNGVKLLVCDAYNDNYKAIKFYYNQGFIGRGTHFIKKL